MAAALDCDVLIVGGGPTGVTLGLLLAQCGVSAIIAEKEADIYPLPRAAHIDHEIVRILQGLGLADAVMAASRQVARYDFLTADRQVLLRFDGSDRVGPGGWPAANMIHQPSIEAALRRRFVDFPAVELRSQWRLDTFDEIGDRVTGSFSTPDGAAKITARYLVGADGARSPVREAAGIAFDDLNFDEPWLVIDAIVHDPSRLPDINQQICDPARPTTCVLMGEGRHRWEFMIRPGETPDQVLDDAFIETLLEPWDVKGAVTLERKAVYRFNARVAGQWRKGRVLLAGDAAHQMPPFAGQGLCSGLRDAANLAWKIGAISRGAADALLDSYQVERDPNVRAIIDLAIMMGRTVCITDTEAAAQRDAQMLAARAAGAAPDGPLGYPPIENGHILRGSAAAGTYFPQPFSRALGMQRMDDVLGAGAWLICRDQMRGGDNGDGPALRVASTSDPDLAGFTADIDAWLAKHCADAVLVRPDRYVFGAGDATALLGAWNDGLLRT